jgi:hypothetical protein
MVPLVITGRAFVRGLTALLQVAAIAAPPGHDVRSLKNRPVLDIRQETEIASFVLSFSHGNGLENLGDIVKPLGTGRLGERGIHVRPFIVFSPGGFFEVFRRSPNDPGRKFRLNFRFPPRQQFEQALGMFLFLIGRFFKDTLDLNIPFFLGLTGKIGISVPRLRFSGKGGQ